VYVDRWHTIFKDRWHTLSHHDTITLTIRDTIPYPVEVSGQSEPPDPVPRFYRFSTIAFWLLLLGLILVLAAYGILRRAFRLGR
ncbi:MAG: hypothetical protein MJZ89_01080, partial [Paludibacteraceae bacterium]|nr:hypothetical protein [Paludibacteraceae bacterium]